MAQSYRRKLQTQLEISVHNIPRLPMISTRTPHTELLRFTTLNTNLYTNLCMILIPHRRDVVLLLCFGLGWSFVHLRDTLLSPCLLGLAGAARGPLSQSWLGMPRAHERVVSPDLFETHHDEGGHDSDPVDVVRDHRAVRGRVVPPQDGIEDAPAAAAIELGGAALRGVSEGQLPDRRV